MATETIQAADHELLIAGDRVETGTDTRGGHVGFELLEELG